MGIKLKLSKMLPLMKIKKNIDASEINNETNNIESDDKEKDK